MMASFFLLQDGSVNWTGTLLFLIEFYSNITQNIVAEKGIQHLHLAMVYTWNDLRP